MQGWERRAFFFPCPLSVSQSSCKRAGIPVATHRGGRLPWAVSSGRLHPGHHHPSPCCKQRVPVTQVTLLWGLRPACMWALYSEFLSFFPVHFPLSLQPSGCFLQLLALYPLEFSWTPLHSCQPLLQSKVSLLNFTVQTSAVISVSCLDSEYTKYTAVFGFYF